MFPKIEVQVPQNGWFLMENPIKMDDLGGKPTIFRKHPNGGNKNGDESYGRIPKKKPPAQQIQEYPGSRVATIFEQW